LVLLLAGKLWNRAWKRGPKETLLDGVLTGDQENADTGELYCQPVQYQVYRAWFGKPPEVRHEDQAALPICDGDSDNCDPILRDSRAIAALHPDEVSKISPALFKSGRWPLSKISPALFKSDRPLTQSLTQLFDEGPPLSLFRVVFSTGSSPIDACLETRLHQ
jgi:hypothetical protein